MNPKKYKVIEGGIKYDIKEYSDGSKFWYFKGKQHRINGPACELSDGEQHWWLNDKLHRINGPACEYANGDKYWFVNNQLHRINGPAIEFANGDKYRYLDGIEYTKKEYYLELLKRGLITKKEAFIELV